MTIKLNGNPGALMSTGVRGKLSIVPTTSTLSALDHDMQSSGSLTPFVYLDCEIPDSPTTHLFEVRLQSLSTILFSSHLHHYAMQLL